MVRYLRCSQGHIQMLLRDGEPVFFTTRDGPWCPTLRIVHQYPDMMKKLRVDTGAIKFVLAGADVMCPGLTSEGATMHDEVPFTPWYLAGPVLTIFWPLSRMRPPHKYNQL
jgi:predicted ribosome-associated RNA-binding protein Tma20